MYTLLIAFIIIAILLYTVPFMLWYVARVAGVSISLLDLTLMKIRKSPMTEIVKGLIAAQKGGVQIQKDELEAIGLAGGDIQNIVNGMIAAKQNNLKLSLQNASKADFSSIDIVKAIQTKNESESEFEKIKFE